MTGERRALGSRYELVDRLGEGAMGEVWRTWDRTGERWVAAKVLRRELARDQQIVGRFVQERSILMSLRHDAIVQVHDLVVEGEALAIVMDLVEGTDLRRHLREVGTLAPRDAVATTCVVLDALAAAHEQSCLHRDVKPDNVLLRDTGSTAYADRVLLTDFGIARLAQERTVQATGLLGTPGYMPPELFVHGRFSAASDVYATGVLLYELLGGRTPFSGAGTAHTAGFRHASVQPPRLPVPAALWQVLETMLAKDPTTRLSAAGTAAALRELPDEVLDAPALDVQPAPDDWDLMQGTVVRAAPVQVELDSAQVDVGRTFQHAAAPPDQHAGTPPAPGRHAPGPGRPSRRILLGAGVTALALVAVVAGVVVATGGDPADPGAAPGVPVQSSVSDPPLPTGLGVQRTADYDPGEQVLTLSLRYSARDAPLGGPFLEVLPGRSGECPSPTWTGATVTANVPQATGIDVACGFAVDPGPVPADGEVLVEARFEADLGAEPAPALDAWLAESTDTAGAALQAQRDGDDYPVQRLRDVVVDVPAVVRKRSSAPTPVVVRLLPDWGDGPDRLRPLFDSSASGQPTSVLRAVAGGFDGVRVQGCDALAVSADGLRVVARYPDPDCTVTAQVGDFTRLEPASLAVLGAGG